MGELPIHQQHISIKYLLMLLLLLMVMMISRQRRILIGNQVSQWRLHKGGGRGGLQRITMVVVAVGAVAGGGKGGQVKGRGEGGRR